MPSSRAEPPRELRIDSLAAGGSGIGRSEGLVWFVPGAFPGDRVLAEAVVRRPSFVKGRLVRRLAGCPPRRPIACPLQTRCGGCPWMPLEEAEQRNWKRILVRDALRRIGRIDVDVAEVIASPALGYRNKVEFTLGRDGEGRPAIGLHARGEGAGLIDVDRCRIQHPGADALLASAREYLMARPETWEQAGTDPFRLIVRRSWLTGKFLVALRETSRPFPGARGLADHLRERHPDLVGVVRLRARTGRRGGTRTIPVQGRTRLTEQIGQTTFDLPAGSFSQVNPAAASELLGLVLRCAGDVRGQAVADLYGGVGSFGIELARRGAMVTVVESDLEALLCGRRAAAQWNSVEVRFERGDVEGFLKRAAVEGRQFDVMVANPPRGGMEAPVTRRIAEQQPGRIVLVSCDPATLARDTRRLVDAGYIAERAFPVDMFPQTVHVETVLSLRRRD